MSMSDEWPSHVQELTRKTAEQLSKWSTLYQTGAISKREYFVFIRGVYDVTSGLIEKELSDLIADIHADLMGLQKRKP